MNKSNFQRKNSKGANIWHILVTLIKDLDKFFSMYEIVMC